MLFTRILPVAALASVLAGSALAQDRTMVKEVDVEADISTIQNPAAAQYWTSIEDDLENAIVARITDRTADDGVKITIDLSEVELSNGVTEAMGLADSRLSGTVKITSETDNTEFNAYDLTVNVDQVIPLMPEGFDVVALTAENRDFYAAMINVFAQSVVDKL